MPRAPDSQARMDAPTRLNINTIISERTAVATSISSRLKADAAINYKTENVEARLKELCPGGIDIYFDNVGGEMLDTVLGQIAFGARVVLCGGTSQYNNDLNWYGPKNYFNLVYKQASMAGYFVSNFAHRYDEALSRLSTLLRVGEMTYAEDILQGIDNVPNALIRILKGDNFGVPLIRLVG